MRLSLSAPIFLLFAAALFSLGLSVYIFTRRRAPGSTALGVLALLIAEWSLTYGLEIAAPDLAQKILWGKAQYIGIAFIPFSWLLFALAYTLQEERSRRLTYVHWLGIAPLATVLLAFTNDAHGLIWRETFLKQTQGLSVLGVKYGAWFWAHFAASYLFLLGGTLVILSRLRRMKGLYRSQSVALIFAVLLPWLGNVAYFVTPIVIDPTPFAFNITIALLVWAIWGYRLTDIVPIARDLILDGLRQGVVVLDLQRRIVDVNAYAARFIGLAPSQIVGRPTAEVLAPWQSVLQKFQDVIEAEDVIEVGTGEAIRQLSFRISPLRDERNNLVGRLITFWETDKAAPARVSARISEPLTQPLPDLQVQVSIEPESGNRLRRAVQGFFLPEPLPIAADEKADGLWRQTIERTLTGILRFGALLGSAALLAFAAVLAQSAPSLLDVVSDPFIYLQALIFAVLWWFAFARRLPFYWRSGVLLFLIYGLTFNEALNYGYSAEAFALLASFVALSGLLLGVRGSVRATAIGLVSMGALGFLIATKVFHPFSVPPEIQVEPTSIEKLVPSMVALTAVTLVVLVAINTLKSNLNRSLAQETQTRNLLQQERDLLEQRVRERTAELREARDQALQSRDELRTYYQAIEQSGNSIVITDPQGVIEYVNPFFEKITGYSLQEAIGQNPRILKSGAQSDDMYRHMWETISHGQIWQGEFLNKRKDGSLYWEFATIAPVKDEQGKINHYVAIKEDITAQKELRETLARQNQYLAALQTITLELLERQDFDELLNSVVERACQLLDASHGEFLLKEGDVMVVRSANKAAAYLMGERATREESKLAWEAHDARQPVILEDYAAYANRRDVYDESPLHAVADFPVLVGKECIGVLALGRSQSTKPFSASEIEYGQALAQIAALVLNNASLYKAAVRELEERKRIQASLEISEQEQRALADILQIGMKEEALESILQTALDELLAIKWLGIEAKGGIFLKDPQSDILTLTVQRNLSPEICALCARVEFGKCHCGRAALTRSLQFSSHVDEAHEITYEGIPDHGHYNAPILSGETVLGTLVLYLPPGYAYNERDARFLQAFASTLSNIIRRKSAENLLRESEIRFRQIVENASDIIYRMDERGRMTYVNPVGLRLFGYEREEEALGRHFSEFAVSQWRSRVKAFYKRQALQQQENTYYEFVAHTKDGREIWLGQNVQIIRFENRVIGFQAVARDITELKETQQALQVARDEALEASRFKSQLVSRVSHELRTPLGGVLGYAELLYQGAFGGLTEEQLDAAGNIVASANYLNIMINELLDQAQIEARAVKIHLAPFQPARLLENIRANMTILSLNKGLRFEPELDPALPPEIIGDERRLQQVLINLCGNAIKFTEQGEVRVSLMKLDDERWAMRVADTGAGIPKEAQELIFEAFRQVDNAITRHNRGTGLGLSITKQLVELMNGKLELESEVGRGSVFTVILPLQTP
ncbi:MAG: PAS domain S-box protein [Chloroflexi bacterium]|nr:PAS domain S-box protein [Chloroflexota bacterium]